MSEVVNIPQLRFPEFYEEWESTKVGKISNKIVAGGTPSTLKPEYWGGDIRWMSSGELNYKKVFEVEKRITSLGLNKSSTKEIPEHCILIGLAGQGKTRGTVAMNMVGLCINQSIAAIHPNNNVFDFNFLYQNLDNRYDELRRLSTGEGGRGGLNLQIIKTLDISLPSPPEQKKIAAFLTAVDNKIELLGKKQGLLKEYKKGLMQKIFAQEIRFKADDGSEFPEWEEKKLGDVVSTPVSDGPHLTPKFVKKGIPFLSVNNLVESKIDFSDVRYISIDDHLVFSKKCKPKKGDVLLGKAASVGKVAFVETDVEFNIWSPIAMIRPSNSNFSKYIYYCFQTRFILNQISKFTNSSSQGNIGMGDISKIIIKLPSKLEQTKIANLLSSIDSKIEQVQKQLDSTKELKKALLQQMFV
jgi:type I restriction enzyme S subunit